MTRVVRRLWKIVLLAILLFMGFYTAAEFYKIYPAPVSLRYTQPLAKTQVEHALDYAADKKNTSGSYPTFWLEQNGGQVTTPYAQVSARILVGLGEGALILPARFIRGGWPGVYDEYGCAVSTQLAWQLWGSTDVLGKEVGYNKRKLLVRGVFEGEEPLLYATGGTDAGYTCVELTPLQGSDKRQAAGNFCAEAGLPTPEHMVYAGSMNFLMQVACWAAVIALALGLLVRLVLACPPSKRRWMMLALLFAAAVLLPLGLSALPGWLIPTRWSDFAFWGKLWHTVGERIEEWLTLPALFKDVMAKWLLFKQGLICVGLLLVTVSIGKNRTQYYKR